MCPNTTHNYQKQKTFTPKQFELDGSVLKLIEEKTVLKNVENSEESFQASSYCSCSTYWYDCRS